MSRISADKARELFSYDPATGTVTRRTSRTSGGGFYFNAGDLAGSLTSKGYWQVTVDRRSYGWHQLAWLITHGSWPVGQIDHINGDRLDNRITNLREVTAAMNAQNIHYARIDSKTGVLGVSWKSNCKKYVAQIQVNGRVLYLGLFDNTDAAHAAYLRVKRESHAGCTI